MSSSPEDVNLIIVYKSRCHFWCGVKGVGTILLDVRFGLYLTDPKPDMTWIKGSMWDNLLIPLSSPLKSPVYGNLIVDFDLKKIVNETNFGSPFELPPEWLLEIWENSENAVLTASSLSFHLEKNKVRTLNRNEIRSGMHGEPLLADFNIAKKQLVNLMVLGVEGPVKVVFDKPIGWNVDGEDLPSQAYSRHKVIRG